MRSPLAEPWKSCLPAFVINNFDLVSLGCKESFAAHSSRSKQIGHFRNVRGLGKSMVVFRLFEKLKYSNERSTIF